jgi:hypothetical protein
MDWNLLIACGLLFGVGWLFGLIIAWFIVGE